MNFLKFLFIIILLLFPFGEFLRFDIGNHIAFKPIDLIILLSAAIWILLKVIKIKELKFPKWYFIAFPCIGFISLIINLSWLKPNEFFVSLLYLIRWLSYFSIFFIVSGFDSAFKKLAIKLLVADGLIILILGFVQYVFFNNLRPLFYLGWDPHMHRIFSVFFDPNFTGAFFVLYFIFTGGLLLSKLKLVKSNKASFIFNFKNINIKTFLSNFGVKNLLFSAIPVLTVLGIYLTFSRSALLMLIGVFFAFLFFIKLRRLLLFLLFLLVFYIVYLYLTTPYYANENMNLLRTASSLSRFANIKNALLIFKDHPVTGVGFNSYRYTKDLYGLDHDWVDAPSHADAGVDNSFVFILATTGIVGFIAYLSIWIMFIKENIYGLNNFRSHFPFIVKKNSFIKIIFIASIGGLALNAMFINSLFYAPIMLWVWIIGGLIDVKN